MGGLCIIQALGIFSNAKIGFRTTKNRRKKRIKEQGNYDKNKPQPIPIHIHKPMHLLLQRGQTTMPPRRNRKQQMQKLHNTTPKRGEII